MTSNLFHIDREVTNAGLIRHPQVKVKLVGEDGNAFAILGRVTRAMQKAGISKAERAAYMTEATAGDYAHLLATTMRWVSCK